MLNYICQQLEQLKIVNEIPESDCLIHSHSVINRATDVLTTVFQYLNIRIRRESNYLGVLGLC